MIGTLGDITFEVSSDTIRTFSQLTRSGQARYQQHDVIGKKPVLEFIGPDLEAVTLPVRLDATKGVRPLTEINTMRDSRDTGERLALVIGGKLLGDFVIEKVDDTWQQIDNRGNLLLANVNLSLKESVSA